MWSAVLTALMVLFVVRYAIRTLRRKASRAFGARVQIAKLHMMDSDKQFEVFHSAPLAATRSRAFEEAMEKSDAAEAAAAEAAVARALAKRNAPAAPPSEVTAPSGPSFGRRRAG